VSIAQPQSAASAANSLQKLCDFLLGDRLGLLIRRDFLRVEFTVFFLFEGQYLTRLEQTANPSQRNQRIGLVPDGSNEQTMCSAMVCITVSFLGCHVFLTCKAH
jgi:hypothetical protein